MEGDAGSGQLTPTPPAEAAENAAPDSDHSDLGNDADNGLRASRLASGRWLTGIVAVVALAAILLAAGGALALWGHRTNAAAAEGEVLAVAAAKDCITATQAPDLAAMMDS